MNDFVYSYPTKVYFGQGAAKKAMPAELGKFGKTVMIAYGGGSINTKEFCLSGGCAERTSPFSAVAQRLLIDF